MNNSKVDAKFIEIMQGNSCICKTVRIDSEEELRRKDDEWVEKMRAVGIERPNFPHVVKVNAAQLVAYKMFAIQAAAGGGVSQDLYSILCLSISIFLEEMGADLLHPPVPEAVK